MTNQYDKLPGLSSLKTEYMSALSPFNERRGGAEHQCTCFGCSRTLSLWHVHFKVARLKKTFLCLSSGKLLLVKIVEAELSGPHGMTWHKAFYVCMAVAQW